MMKRFFFATLTAALLLTGCYKDDLWQMHKELDTLRDVTIASLSEQAKNMASSITDLNALNSDLKDFIRILDESGASVTTSLEQTGQMIDDFSKTSSEDIDASKDEFLLSLESLNDVVTTQVNTFSTLVSSLDSNSDALQTRIDLLKVYLEGFAETDWLKATYATLEIQSYLDSVLASSKEEVLSLIEFATETDSVVKHIIDSAFTEYRDEFSDRLNTRADEFATIYASDLFVLRKALKDANAEKIAQEIEKSEESLKGWINKRLDDYYKLDSLNAQCKIFDLILGVLPEGKETYQEELDDLYKAIGEARTSITTAYEKAIKDAIAKQDTTISEKIATEIAKIRTDVISPIDVRIGTLKSQISELKNDALALDVKIKSAEDQKAAISTSIAILNTLEKTLEQYIASVKAELVSKEISDSSYLKGLVDALDALVKGSGDESIPSIISDLNGYIGTLPDGQEDISTWISTTLATFEAQFSTIKKITEVDEIFTDLQNALDTDNTLIGALEDSLDNLLTNNEAKIKGWINKKLEGYYKTGEIEGLLESLGDRIDSYFKEGDSKIQERIDSLAGTLAGTKEELTNAYTDSIKNAITYQEGIIKGRLISDFAKVNSSVAAIGAKADTLKHIVDSLRTDLDSHMARVGRLKDSLSTLETFLYAKSSENEAYSGIHEMVTDLLEKINSLSTVYANAEEFGKVKKYIDDTLYVEAKNVIVLWTRLEAVTGKLDAIEKFVSGFDTTGTSLYDQVQAIRTSIDSLQRYVFGVDTLGIKSYQNQINEIMKALFGTEMDPDNPSKGSIVFQLDSLNARIVATHITSITYIPRFLDQTEEVYKNYQDSASAEFRFIVKPAGVAELIKDDLIMKYKPVTGDASSLKSYATTSVTVYDGDMIEVHVTAPAEDIFANDGKTPEVCSALFYSNKDDEGNVLSSFTSKFIFFSFKEDESTGKIPVIGGRHLHFPAEGGTLEITIGNDTMTVDNRSAYWLVRPLEEREEKGNIIEIIAIRAYNTAIGLANADNRINGLFPPEWVTVSPEYKVDYQGIAYPFISYYEGIQTIKITAEPNDSSKPRSGKLVFRVIFKTIEEFRDSATGSKDLIIYVEQDGKVN